MISATKCTVLGMSVCDSSSCAKFPPIPLV